VLARHKYSNSGSLGVDNVDKESFVTLTPGRCWGGFPAMLRGFEGKTPAVDVLLYIELLVDPIICDCILLDGVGSC